MASKPQTPRPLLSKVSGGNKTLTLRIYIPKPVAEALGLKVGDVLRWAVISEDGRPIAKLKKVKLVVEDF